MVLCLGQAHAVLKEKDLGRTLAVLRSELEADYLKQKQFLQRYETQSQQQHQQLMEYMAHCEQISLILYSQKADFTFDMAYACQEATDLYKQLGQNNLPYDRIRQRIKQELERYDELILALKQMPPVEDEGRDTVLTEADTTLMMMRKRMRIAEQKRMAEGDSLHTHSSIMMLTPEQQRDRKACLLYAQTLRNNMEQFLEQMDTEQTYYTSVSNKAQRLNDFAQSRYSILKQNIFVNGGSNYWTILSRLPLYVMLCRNDLVGKYRAFDSKNGTSEWRGKYVLFISIFMFVYMGIAALLSNVIVRWCIPRRLRETGIYQEKKSMLIASLGVLLFAVVVMIVRMNIDRNFVLMSTSLMTLIAWLLEVIFVSFLIRLNKKQMQKALKVYDPFILMAFIVIIFRIILIPNSLVNLIYPPILLGFTIWQWVAVSKHRSGLPNSDFLYSSISTLAMTVACVASFVGYTLLAVEIMVWWMFQLAAIQTITCIYDVLSMYENRILLVQLNPSLKALKNNPKKSKEYAAEAKRLQARMKDGDYIEKSWFFDLVKMAFVPVLGVLSVLASIYWSAQIFEMTSLITKYFYYNFYDDPKVIQLSLFKVCLVAAFAFIFRYINYALRSLYRHYRKRLGGANETFNLTLANNLIAIIVWGGFLLFALIFLQVPKDGISIVTAGLATGLGFAMKDLLENFIYGINLMTGRIRVGDYIECDGIQGRVESISYQSTQIVTPDGSIISFLNSALFSKNFKNITRNHRFELIKIPIGVAYGSNVDQVRHLITEAIKPICQEKNASGKPITNTKLGVKVAFRDFGESSVDLDVCVWMLVEEKVALTARIKETIYNTLNEHHIEIPFPQRDVHIIPITEQP